jgi:hypothetical protein
LEPAPQPVSVNSASEPETSAEVTAGEPSYPSEDEEISVYSAVNRAAKHQHTETTTATATATVQETTTATVQEFVTVFAEPEPTPVPTKSEVMTVITVPVNVSAIDRPQSEYADLYRSM